MERTFTAQRRSVDANEVVSSSTQVEQRPVSLELGMLSPEPRDARTPYLFQNAAWGVKYAIPITDEDMIDQEYVIPLGVRTQPKPSRLASPLASSTFKAWTISLFRYRK